MSCHRRGSDGIIIGELSAAADLCSPLLTLDQRRVVPEVSILGRNRFAGRRSRPRRNSSHTKPARRNAVRDRRRSIRQTEYSGQDSFDADGNPVRYRAISSCS